MNERRPHTRSHRASSPRPASRPRPEASPRYVRNPSGQSIQLETPARKIRWEVYYVIAVVLIVTAILGVGAFIAVQKAKPALERATPGVQQAVAASAEAVPAGASASSQAAADPTPTPAVDRAADFAVDPERTDWSYASNGRKTVYLTIDDGPSENTQAVLDILDRYNAKATFFVVGHNPDYYSMIAEAFKRGHTIGMHTYSHNYAEVYASPENYFADLDAIGQVVKEQIGFVPCFIRFPGGSSNEISAEYYGGIMSELAEAVQQRGYQYWDWNLSVGDGDDHSAEELVGYGTEPVDTENIVLLCHDSATKATTVEALPAIIEHYQGLGYSFEALDRSSLVCHHGILN